MSNFYYCNDCKKAVDLETEQNEADHSDFSYDTSNCETVCKECGGTNWNAEIDCGHDGYKKVNNEIKISVTGKELDKLCEKENK